MPILIIWTAGLYGPLLLTNRSSRPLMLATWSMG